MDVEALQTGAKMLEGEHDFASFAATDPDVSVREAEWEERNTVRSIYSSTWERRQSEAGELLIYGVRGSGFLHHMVRNMVGTLLEVGRGKLKAEAIGGILAARARSAAGATAPARGLFLSSVEYGEDG
jgi:tRNA pseudouridine38-40 synthase